MREKLEGFDNVSIPMKLCGAAESRAFQSTITDPTLQTNCRLS
jgi:hypothetical protein